MTSSIRAADLPTLLDRQPGGLRFLSLDCFDTLLWRNVQSPVDVFAELPCGIERRAWAEGAARRAARYAEDRSAVSIGEIYAKLLPAATAEERAGAVAAELAAEARHCHGFAPTIALIEAARARALGVIVVSDTYLAEPQLRALIAAAAGDDVAAMIDRIFCSSDFGRCKGEGLFEDVLAALGVLPSAILHAGDNPDADLKAPTALGLRAIHFRQFDGAAEHRLRLEAAAGAMLDPAVRAQVPALQPHRPAVSLRTDEDAAGVLGHDVMGPIMAAFAGWVRAEADALAAREGRRPRMLFLLRDGHLPQRAYAALGHDDAVGVELSRFTATAASFVDEAAVREYLAGEAGGQRAEVIARQLLFPDAEAAKLIRAGGGKGDEARLKAALTKPEVLARVVTRSRRFADRLIAHLRRAGVAQGDAVLLVDLGYNGSVQNLVTPVLERRMGLRVAGRYLLLREQNVSGLDKRGLLDMRHYDARALIALAEAIAVVEQLCTVPQGSVIDYDDKGRPIRKAAGVKGAQSAVRERVQQACLGFVADAHRAIRRPAGSDGPDARRGAAAAVLARLLFLPAPEEVALLGQFEHDVNLGTRELQRLLDHDASAEGLRRRGLPYLQASRRMYLPGELAGHGLPLALSFFSQRRFGLDLRHGDFAAAPITLPVMLADAASQTIVDFAAHPTHDGYYLATIPIGAARFALGVQWGRLCEWVQIEEIGFHAVDAFRTAGGEPGSAVQPLWQGMAAAADGLYRCDPAGFMFVTPPAGDGRTPLLLGIVFRPVTFRKAEAAALRRAA